MRSRPTDPGSRVCAPLGLCAWLATLALLLAGAATSHAEEEASSGQEAAPQQEQSQQIPQASPQERMQEVQQRLAAAEEKAFEANPDLQSQREALEALMVETMEDKGYDPKARIATLESLRGKVQDPSLSEADRQQMMQEAQEAHRSLREAQQVAMEDGSVTTAREAFREDLIAAMRAEEPRTDALIEEFQQLKTQMESHMQQMMQQQMRQQQMQGAAPAPDEGQ